MSSDSSDSWKVSCALTERTSSRTCTKRLTAARARDFADRRMHPPMLEFALQKVP